MALMRVHVWRPHDGMVGHAALSYIIKGGLTSRYLSFWPAGSAGKKSFLFGMSGASDLDNTLDSDCRNESPEEDGFELPSDNIDITEFDCLALVKFIDDLKGGSRKYSLSKCNCSSIVSEALYKATGRAPSFKPNMKNYPSLVKMFGRGVWTPSAIVQYANELTFPAPTA